MRIGAAVLRSPVIAPRGEAPFHHLGRRLLPVLVLGVLVLAGLLGAANPRQFLSQLRRFDFVLLAPIGVQFTSMSPCVTS